MDRAFPSGARSGRRILRMGPEVPGNRRAWRGTPSPNSGSRSRKRSRPPTRAADRGSGRRASRSCSPRSTPGAAAATRARRTNGRSPCNAGAASTGRPGRATPGRVTVTRRAATCPNRPGSSSPRAAARDRRQETEGVEVRQAVRRQHRAGQPRTPQRHGSRTAVGVAGRRGGQACPRPRHGPTEDGTAPRARRQGPQDAHPASGVGTRPTLTNVRADGFAQPGLRGSGSGGPDHPSTNGTPGRSSRIDRAFSLFTSGGGGI